MCIHLLLRTTDHYPNSMPWPHLPHTKRQLRQKPIINFNTITYFYIYIHLHKKTKTKQYCQKISLTHKTHKLQHKSDWVLREREREIWDKENRKKRKNWNTCLRLGVAPPRPARWRLRFLFPDLAFVVADLAFAVVDLAFAAADLTISNLGQVNLQFRHHRAALGVQCCRRCLAESFFFFFRIAAFNALLSRCYSYC